MIGDGSAGAVLLARLSEDPAVSVTLLDHGRKTVLSHGYSCRLCILQPKSRGRVRLASNNARTMPLIDPAFFAPPDDMHRMREILNQPALAGLGGKELAHSAQARSDAPIEQFIRN